MTWSTVNRCLFAAALFHPPTSWLDDELDVMAAECGSGPECATARQQVAGLAGSLEERETEYARLFLLNPEGVPAQPYGSYWLERQQTLNGETTREVHARMSDHGLSPSGGLLADYIAAELEFLAWLLEQGGLEDARWLMDHHLKAWTPDFLEALRSANPHPFYRGAAEFLESTLAVVCSEMTRDRQQVGGH